MSKRKLTTGTVVNATKEKIDSDAALELLGRHSRLLVARGQKVLSFDLAKETPSEDELLAVIMGRSGNLRAPTLIRGKTVAVGFNETMYEDLLG